MASYIACGSSGKFDVPGIPPDTQPYGIAILEPSAQLGTCRSIDTLMLVRELSCDQTRQAVLRRRFVAALSYTKWSKYHKFRSTLTECKASNSRSAFESSLSYAYSSTSMHLFHRKIDNLLVISLDLERFGKDPNADKINSTTCDLVVLWVTVVLKRPQDVGRLIVRFFGTSMANLSIGSANKSNGGSSQPWLFFEDMCVDFNKTFEMEHIDGPPPHIFQNTLTPVKLRMMRLLAKKERHLASSA